MKMYLSVERNLCSSSVNYVWEALIPVEEARRDEAMFKGQRCNLKKEASRRIAASLSKMGGYRDVVVEIE